jgi:soluble lytic murein transglycosylase
VKALSSISCAGESLASPGGHFRIALILILILALLVVPAQSFAESKTPASAASPEQELEQLARTLHDNGTARAYDNLRAFAQRRSSGLLGKRAALALGYFDYSRGHYPQALRWLRIAEDDLVLREYALYWGAMTERAMNNNAGALAQLSVLHRDFPGSVMNEQILQALGETALAVQKPASALAALDAEPSFSSRPALLFLRGELREQAGRLDAAAADYQAVYYQLPLTPQATEAGNKLSFLAAKLGDKFPKATLEEKKSRAQALYDSHRWREANEVYSRLLNEFTGADRELAQLRMAQCRVGLGSGADVLISLAISDAEVDAERLYSLSQVYRSQKREPEMLAAVEHTAARSPKSRWTEQAFFSTGNYYWVQLDLDRAGQFYRRVVQDFPGGSTTVIADWRVAWQAYRQRQPQAASLLEEHIRRHPGSTYVSDALYWLGRVAERSGNVPLARAYYTKLADRYPQNYFGARAVERLRAIGPGLTDAVAILSQIPLLPAAPRLDEDVPPAAAARRDRAIALHSIAFDASAELEFRAAYIATGAPSLLLEAAQEAVEARRYGVAFVTIRQIVSQLESRPFSQVSTEVWRVAYPLPFRSELERSAARAGVDPMQVAGLIRQESAFQPEAFSHAGAMGLMQLIPSTAKKMAKQTKLRFSRPRLFEPEYNLRLGTVYLANLKSSYGSLEAALAAYNAGEDRVAAWESGRTYDEPAEFVDSIPFTETREYVQVVMRNGAIYRQVYGPESFRHDLSGKEANRQKAAEPKVTAETHRRGKR